MAAVGKQVSREGQLKGGLRWNLGVTVFLLSLLFFAVLLTLPTSRQTIGLALSYTLFRIAPSLVLSLIEQLTKPAGPRKSAKRWLLHLQIILANHASGIPFGILGAHLASVLVNALGFVTSFRPPVLKARRKSSRFGKCRFMLYANGGKCIARDMEGNSIVIA